MKEKQPNTYEFPREITSKYFQLINSREEFLNQGNLTNAKRQDLITLFEKLMGVWNLNNSEILKTQLQENYIELRKIKKEIEFGSENFKKDTREKLKKSLNQRENDLIMREENLTKENKNFQIQENTLTIQEQFWKMNIIEKEKKLENPVENINLQNNAKLEELKEELEKLKALILILRKESVQFELKQKQLTLKLYDSEKLKDEYLKISQMNIQKKITVKENLKNLEESLIDDFKMKILSQHPHLDNALKRLLKEENCSPLSNLILYNSTNLTTQEKLLNRKLGEIGIGRDLFLEKMRLNTNTNLK